MKMEGNVFFLLASKQKFWYIKIFSLESPINAHSLKQFLFTTSERLKNLRWDYQQGAALIKIGWPQVMSFSVWGFHYQWDFYSSIFWLFMENSPKRFLRYKRGEQDECKELYYYLLYMKILQQRKSFPSYRNIKCM